MERITLITQPAEEYQLLDSGEEEKLEKYGEYTLARPDPQALWPKNLLEDTWKVADGQFVREGGEGKWRLKESLPKEWPINFNGLRFLIKPTSFKHTGLFPEQAQNWAWVASLIKAELGKRATGHSPKERAEQVPSVSVLNLFAYTGGATLAAAQAGAEVVHVDASKTAVSWARENAELSGLADKPIRWIVEDVLTYVEREIKRGSRYDLIIMDPPAFGHGPKDELWKIEEHFPQLVRLCMQLLSEKPLGMLINGYAAGYSPLAFAYNIASLQKQFGGSIEYGDLTIEEQGSGASQHRLLPCGIFARWKAN